MKKLITILCAVILFAGLNLQAAPVSQRQALDIAKKIFAAQPGTKAVADVKLIWDGEDVATKGVQPAFYVFGRDGGGFVIIAGDDNVQPVLAISDRNEFKVEGMPDNVKWWMERMKAYVRSSAKQTVEVQAQWEKFIGTKAGDAHITGTVKDKVEKLTPEWDQGNNDPKYFGEGIHVFNKKCPKDGGEYSVTGCVATALAELLTYQSGQDGVSMPASASGTVGGYAVGSGYVAPAAYELGTTYKWEQLRSLTNIAAVKAAVDANNTELLDNLAQLMADLGAMVKASYSKDGTSAVTSNAIGALIEHMGFNKAAYYAEASSYSERQWVALLKAELNKRPLIYSGRTTGNAGHAFLFDGYGKYNETDVFHVNFGWGGGDCNGYYYHTHLDSGNGDYSYQCGAIFDFYPKAGSEYPTRLVAAFDDNESPGVRVKEDPSDGTFLAYYSISNLGNNNYSGEIQYYLKKKAGGEPEIIPSAKKEISILSGNGISGYFGYFPINEYTFGDQVICKYYDGSDWVQLGCVTGTAIAEWPLVPTAFIKTKASYDKGEYFQFELRNNDYIYAGTKWTITDPNGNTRVLDQSDFEYQLTMTGSYKIEAATAASKGGPVIETIETYITVK